MRRRNNRFAVAALGLLLAGALALSAQHPRTRTQSGEFILQVDVDLVVLYATVSDNTGRHISELAAANFRVFEDDVEQKLAKFSNEDVPVTVGLVLDNSASMRENRPAMMAGALRFAQTANPLDEVFVVNFNDDYYLDLESKDFTNNLADLKSALEKTTTRGSTAFFDALRASLQHLRRGTRQKKVLLTISDGVDNASVSDFQTLLHDAQQSEAAFYVVALPCSDEKRNCRKARRQIRELVQATGGLAYFPTSIEQVEAICNQIAHDIRNQYVLGYYPTNKARDGSFRAVRVEVISPKGYGRLVARTRTGYYAAAPASAGSQ